MPTEPTTTIADHEREAFDRTAADRDAVDASATGPYNMDAVYAAAQAELIARRITPYRSIMEALPGFNIAHVERFVDYANALVFIQTTLVSRATRTRQLPDLANEGYELRKVLLAYGDLLALQGVFQDKVIARLREGSGYRDLIEDLGALVRLYQAHPEVTGPGAPIGHEQIGRAAELARTMRTELGLDQEPDMTQDALLEARRKTAWLLLRAHRQIRRAMDYIRYDEGDAASLVPPLYPSGKRKSKPTEETDPHAELAALHDALHEHEHPHEHADPLDSPFVDA